MAAAGGGLETLNFCTGVSVVLSKLQTQIRTRKAIAKTTRQFKGCRPGCGRRPLRRGVAAAAGIVLRFLAAANQHVLFSTQHFL